jgi:hypothetical protein
MESGGKYNFLTLESRQKLLSSKLKNNKNIKYIKYIKYNKYIKYIKYNKYNKYNLALFELLAKEIKNSWHQTIYPFSSECKKYIHIMCCIEFVIIGRRHCTFSAHLVDIHDILHRRIGAYIIR